MVVGSDFLKWHKFELNFGSNQKGGMVDAVAIWKKSPCAKKAQIVGISAKRRMKFSIVTQWVIACCESPTWLKVSHQASSEIRG